MTIGRAGAVGPLVLAMVAFSEVGAGCGSPEPQKLAVTVFYPNAAPTSLAVGPDQNVWFSSMSGARFGYATKNGESTTFPWNGVGAFPAGITAGPDGKMWFVDTGQDALVSTTLTGETRGLLIPGRGSGPTDIVAGADGNFWITERGTRNGVQYYIARVSPALVVTEFPVPSGRAPGHIVPGPDGNLWFTADLDGIGRISLSGEVTEFSAMTTEQFINGINAGPDGALWFTANAPVSAPVKGGGLIGRITTTGEVTLFPLAKSMPSPSGIVAGPDGNLWFTEASTCRIARITPAGRVTPFALPIEGRSITGEPCRPESIIVGPDGNLWFGETSIGRIGYFTPPTDAGG